MLERGGVLTGGRRYLVACSNEYANLSKVGSLQGLPKNSIPTGTPIGADSLRGENPAGIVIAGKPVIDPRTPFLST